MNSYVWYISYLSVGERELFCMDTRVRHSYFVGRRCL